MLFISGNHADAKKKIAEIIESLGFATIDLGDLANGSELQQAKGSLATVNLIKL